ncbi:MAG TPA: hypothetical protein VFY36_09760 [Solirubrobacteraceae bacterium]|nr:hypothetical protein [Solirubrobacteraceae bacterium]
MKYRRALAAAAILIVALIVVNALLSKPIGSMGIALGRRVPPFAVPLALAQLKGDANVAKHANDGEAGKRPACSVRGPEILNICQLYEHRPVVLALFLDAGSCAGILEDFQALAPAFPGVAFAAVAIKGDRSHLRTLIRDEHLGFPVGYDEDGALTPLYEMASCPQVTFAYPGGIVQRPALLRRPSRAALRAAVGRLLAASHARGARANPAS